MTPITDRSTGWRCYKGPHSGNTSGLRAVGHKLLLLDKQVETQSAGGIVFAPKTIDKERNANTVATVIEVGHDCFSDKGTDFCEVGDKVLIGQYVGKFHTSEKDGKTYRLITDLDVLSTIED